MRGSDEAQTVQRAYWTHVGSYTSGQEFPTYDEAITAARAAIQTFDYGELGIRHSREFAALRLRTNKADAEALRFEVFLNGVALVPDGQGGLSEEQTAALALGAAR